MADLLSRQSASREYDVLWDPHRVDYSFAPLALPGEIKCFFGDALSRRTELAQLDIAIVRGSRRKAIVLIEIEETGSSPKTLLGDALATLIAERISFRGQPLLVGSWTTLLLLGHSTRKRHTAESQAQFISQKIEGIRTVLSQAPQSAGNQCIGQIVVKVFGDENELSKILTQDVQTALTLNQNDEQI